LEEYSCPICLNVIRNPVVLSCAHKFCWGCIVTLCSTVRRDANDHRQAIGEKMGNESKSILQTAVWETESSDDENSTVATFSCPCCRKQELLDLDRLHVDQHLEKYLKELEQSSAEGTIMIFCIVDWSV
jgi:RNA polymerase II subunit A small phosphatase-like protein